MLGSGTELDPYQVETASDLNDVRNNLSAYYIQTANIDLSEYANWTPIGAILEDGDTEEFNGFYDGQNFNISNLTMSYSNDIDYSYYFGLFGIIGDYWDETILSEVKNIKLVNVNIEAPHYVGSLAGASNARVTNCTSSGVIIGRGTVGGLIGFTCDMDTSTENHLSDVIECSSSCDIYTVSWDKYSYTLGGLIGSIGNYYTSKCFATGSITTVYEPAEDDTSDSIGGFAGYVFGGRKYVGGVLVPNPDKYVIIENCYAMGDIGGYRLLGGFIGVTSDIVEITNCYSKGYVPVSLDTGGFCGRTTIDSSFTSCYYNTETSGHSDNDGRGAPKTTLEMKTQATFVDWDFSSIWGINPNINDGYPYLRWENMITSVICKKAKPNFLRFNICTTT